MLLNTGPNYVRSTHGLLTTLAFRLGPKAQTQYALEGSIAVAGLGISWMQVIPSLPTLRMQHPEARMRALRAG